MLTNLEVYSAQATPPDLPLVLGAGADTDPIHIREITGLGPVKANVSTRPFGSLDGEYLTGTNVGKRNIVITIGFNPDWGSATQDSVAKLREIVYGYFMPKQTVTLRFFRDNAPTAQIEGVVEGAEPNIFSKDPTMQLSVICPDPDFIAASPTLLTDEAVEDATWFEFSTLANKETPFFFRAFTAEDDETTYDDVIRLEHKTLDDSLIQHFEVTGTITEGIDLQINTERGNKYVRNRVVIISEDTNLLQTLTTDSEWLMLQPGVNQFRALLADGAPAKQWELTYYERYGGL